MPKAKILVVEDEILFAKSLQLKLENEGYSICSFASSGEEAMRTAEKEKPDVVLMDIMLHGAVDGIEAADWIRSHFSIPVIYLTAYSSKDMFDRARITEPFGYLLKPIEDQELYANIEMALYKAKMEEKLRKSEEELKKYRFHLEDMVQKRTSELAAANKKLQQEITERRKIETNLRESQIKYSTLVEQANEGVIVVQEEKYKFVNKAMVDITGYTVEELSGKHPLDIVTPDLRDLLAKRHALRMAGQKVPSFYGAKIQHKDGKIRDVELFAALIEYNGKPADMLIIHNVTERKEMEQELQKMEKLESIGILAGGIAHDFNNLLTAVIGNLSLAELYIKSGGNVLEVVKRSQKAGRQAKELTQQLLTFSKGGEPIKKIASIEELLKDTAAFALIGSKVRCEFFIADNLCAVEVDEGQISQVIHNLIINACQAMPHGGIIKVAAENVTIGENCVIPLEGGDYIRISVKDQGAGIPEEYLHHIFDPFFTTKKEGSGLGLAVSYSIIKKHKGYITVDSMVGFGTTFTIFLPVSKKEIFIVNDIIEETPRGGRGRILLMDDQENIREMASEMLVYLGYQVESVHNGDEAVELYKKAKESGHGFDAVILDLTIPGEMGGQEIIQRLSEIDFQVKAIVSSGHTVDPVMANHREYGFSGVISKPYDIKELSETLHDVIKGSGKDTKGE